tara:strand:+ start:366 stop:719 length:354 start_codon:yes stop_codon:yes gene_type:complete
MKTIIAAGILLASAPAAIAGPYVNIEGNTSVLGDDYLGSTIELHKGYEGEIGDSTSWYVQAGPALIMEDGSDTDVEFSGKVGLVTDISEKVEVYGEYAFVTGDDFGSGVKAGATYRF